MQITNSMIAGAALLVSAMVAYGQSSIEGAYSHVPDKSPNIDAAIEKAVAEMSFIKRPIARSRLKRTNSVYRTVAISRTGDQIVVALNGTPIKMPAAGQPVKWKRDDGEIFDVSAAWRETALDQTFKAEDGTRVNTFRLNADGTMTMDVTISSEQLPQPIKYSIAYRRSS